mmetsp:Transcript_20622/g.46671  ORF Transcript_20622/g.46671 Transcript_20622/m.46671 type:complete len:145 (-) Transcript_20622:134-568(-)
METSDELSNPTASYSVQRGILVESNESANEQQSSRGSLVMGNCRKYKRASLLSSKCTCGMAKGDPCHSIPHICKICGETFTALQNTGKDCKVHPLNNVVVVGSRSHATHQFQTYIWECCPDKPLVCSTKEAFIERGITHDGEHY